MCESTYLYHQNAHVKFETRIMDVTNYDSERVMDISPTSLPSPHNTNDWRVTERTYNKLWQACSERLVPSRPRFSPRRSSCHGRYGRQIPAATCWGRCRRTSTIPRLSLSWQCCFSGSPEVLSIDHRPNTNGRLSASPDYRHWPHTLTKRSDDLPRSQVFPDPLSPPPPVCLHTISYVYVRDKNWNTHLRHIASIKRNKKIYVACQILSSTLFPM